MGSGPEQLRLSFPIKVLGLNSLFFRVKTEFFSSEAHPSHLDPIIDLSDQDVDLMNVFFAWNTTGDIYSAKRLTKIIKPSGRKVTVKKLDEYKLLWDRLLECYFLADFLGAPKFGNAVVDALFDIIDAELTDRNYVEILPEEKIFGRPVPSANDSGDDQNDNDDWDGNGQNDAEDEQGWMDTRDPFKEVTPQMEIRQMLGTLPYQIRRMYSNTGSKSLLRRMLIDKIIQQGTIHDYYRKISCIVKENLPIEFHRDLVQELMCNATTMRDYNDRRAVSYMRAENKCFYHVHELGERCNENRSG